MCIICISTGLRDIHEYVAMKHALNIQMSVIRDFINIHRIRKPMPYGCS